jgi:uncharacterized protein
MPSRVLRALSVCALAVCVFTAAPKADLTPQTLAFSQDWSNIGLITLDDTWAGVPGIVGYRGDGMVGATGVNPQTVTADGSSTPVDVNADETNPNTFTTGGVAEFHLANPVVALQGSGTARAPHLVITVSTAGLADITISYNLRDIDGSADNAVQPVALQYRVGTSGSYTNVPAGFVADATTGSSATQVTAVTVTLPAAVADQPVVQVRIITTDAAGSDEWVGIDDISITGVPVASTAPAGTGASTPASVFSGESSLLTVKVTPGANPASTNVSVTADLSAIGGSATSTLFDNGTHGDATLGDNVFSLQTIVMAVPGTKSISFVVSDAQERSTTGSFALVVQLPPIAIHDVQGSGSESPYTGQTITTTGIVTALRSNSFYMEAPEQEWDADPQTSEGLAIFTGSPIPAVHVGDRARVTGPVAEFRPRADPGSPPITELSGAITTTILSTGNSLPAPVTLTASDTTTTGGFEQLERYEGMRVAATVTATSGTQAFSRSAAEEANNTSTSNGTFFAVISGVTRSVREPGIAPEENQPVNPPANLPRFDGDPERLRVVSDGQIGASKIEILAGQQIPGLTGVLDYGFRVYTIVPDPGVWTPTGNTSAVPVPVPNANEFTIASFNMERFYDDRENKNGAQTSEVVMTTEAFHGRLAKVSMAIRDVMRSPDIIGVQEVENFNALTEIATRVNADIMQTTGTDAQYVPYLVEGNDVGGIDVGLLVKSTRVSVVSVEQIGKDATYLQPNGVTALLNDRPSLLMKAIVYGPGGVAYPVTFVVNHLRSLNGVDDSDGRVRAKRAAQAEFLAAELQKHHGENLISVGDYNAFPFNDGWADVVGTIKGQPAPADQVMVASPDLVTPDLVNVGDSLGAQQYSFVFDGIAQALDHVLVSPEARIRFTRIQYARNDADFPDSFRSDATRPERISDHDMPVAYFSFPGAPSIALKGAADVTIECCSTFTQPSAADVDASDPDGYPVTVTVSDSVDVAHVGNHAITYTADNGFLTSSVTRTIHVVDTTAPTLTLNGPGLVTIEAGTPWSDPGAAAADACTGDLTHQITATGSVLTTRPGSYVLTYAVSDASGNQASVTRTVIVIDTTAPTIGSFSVTPEVLNPPNHRLADITVGFSASDVTETTMCSVAVSSDERVNGPGDGHTIVDWQVVSTSLVRVRGERSGLGAGRTYFVTLSCSDGSGNVSKAIRTVLVPR